MAGSSAGSDMESSARALTSETRWPGPAACKGDNVGVNGRSVPETARANSRRMEKAEGDERACRVGTARYTARIDEGRLAKWGTGASEVPALAHWLTVCFVSLAYDEGTAVRSST